MDRSRFNNILYAIQVLANHDLTGQSQEEAMPYLRAINSCVQSLLEVHWSDMGGMTYASPPTACASETLRHSYETLQLLRSHPHEVGMNRRLAPPS